MAGVLEEFDEATPLKSTYCSRLSAEEYEEQGSACTERALAELLGHLDENPEVYKDILSKKKKQDQENAGFLSYVKVVQHDNFHNYFHFFMKRKKYELFY